MFFICEEDLLDLKRSILDKKIVDLNEYRSWKLINKQKGIINGKKI